MSAFDDHLRYMRSFEPIQRAMDEQRRVEKALRLSGLNDPILRILEEERRRQGAISAHELAGQVAMFREQAAHQAVVARSALQREFEQHRLLLERAASPLPARILDQLRYQDELARQYEHIRLALRDAPLWANFTVAEPDAEDDEDFELAVESQLIEVVPPEALEELRRGRFAPFSLLAKAIARPEAVRDLSPRAFEEFIAELTSRLGLENVHLTPPTADGGRDIVGTFKVGRSVLLVALECKRYRHDRAVGVAFARALLGTIYHPDSAADHGILVTTSRFSAPARRFIVTAPRLEGVEFDGIVDWLRRVETGRRLELRHPTT